VCLNRFIFKCYKNLVDWKSPRESREVNIVTLCRLTYNHVPIALYLKHCDLTTSIRNQKCLSIEAKSNICRNMFIFLILKVYHG